MTHAGNHRVDRAKRDDGNVCGKVCVVIHEIVTHSLPFRELLQCLNVFEPFVLVEDGDGDDEDGE